MTGKEFLIECTNCRLERKVRSMSMVIPLVNGSACFADGEESAKHKCGCGCESFYLLDMK